MGRVGRSSSSARDRVLVAFLHDRFLFEVRAVGTPSIRVGNEFSVSSEWREVVDQHYKIAPRHKLHSPPAAVLGAWPTFVQCFV